mmetsp:Transcript_45472/g.147759  ORF Transcript_45472/g.147759 Transcript_45472/m.147759 type:complete len:219 (-) Transcript_45472:1388-2044(-)
MLLPPRLRLGGDVAHLVDAHHLVARRVHLLEVLQRRDLLVEPPAVKPVEQRLLHHLGGGPVLAQVEGLRVDIRVDGAGDPRHMGRLCEVVRSHAVVARRPEQHVVSEVARDRVRRLLARDEALAHQGDVLEVPSVAVGESRAVGDAADLVPVVPPRHHARVARRLVAQPPIGLAEVVVHRVGPVVVPRPHHDVRLRDALCDAERMRDETNRAKPDHRQ